MKLWYRIISLTDLKDVEFSTTIAFQKGEKTKLAEELNLFKMETPSIQVKDFTEDFTVESPIAEFIKSMKVTKHKKDKKDKKDKYVVIDNSKSIENIIQKV